MGKRELLLIVGFVMVGTMVYFATAPEPAPGENGFSLSRILDHVRREIRGNPGSAEVTTTSTVPLKRTITELRFDDPRTATITVVGEDRTDLACELLVWSNGADHPEAVKYATETKLKYTDAGSTLAISIDYPEPGSQRATLKVRVPTTLAVRVQPNRGKLELTDLASVEVVEARGQVTVRRISNRLVITHRGGPLTLEGIASLKLNSRGSNVTVKDLRGPATLQMQAGELRGSMLGGPTEVESNGTRISIEGFSPTQKPLRLTTVGGSATLAGVTSDVRIDARDTRLDVTVDKPAPIAIYTEGDDPLNIALPPKGFELEALAIDSRLVVPEGLPEVKTSGNEQRASGRVGSGGPTITLRASRAEMTIRINDGAATSPSSPPPAPPAPPAPPRPPR